MIELPVTANNTGTRFNFPDLPQLRSDVTQDIWIRSIETFSIDSILSDFNGNPVASLANIQVASLTLYVNGSESIFRIPLVKLLNTFLVTIAPGFWTEELNQFDNLEVDWTKSYVSIPAPFTSPFTQFAFVFGIGYYRLKPGTMNTIKAMCKIPESCDLPPGIALPDLAALSDAMQRAPGSFQ